MNCLYVAHLLGIVQPWGRSGNTLTTAIRRLLIEQQCGGDGDDDCFQPLSDEGNKLVVLNRTAALFC
ncbi:5-dioxygenase oxygenase subunit,Phthalate 4 [Trichinella pseudospiralis]